MIASENRAYRRIKKQGFGGLLTLACVGVLLCLGGCAGEGFPDPSPPTGDLPPVIYGFERQISGDEWVPTSSGSRGAAIGVVGKNFGDDLEGLQVTFNGAPAELIDLQPYPGRREWKRIVTRVPDSATTGPVVVAREGMLSEAVPFYVVLVLDSSWPEALLPAGTASPPDAADPSIWVGTATGGILYAPGGIPALQEGDFQRYTTVDGLRSNKVETLLKDPAGRVLAGTEDGGLAVMGEDGRFTSFTRDGGLPSNTVLSLHISPAGDLLVGTPQGFAVWEGYVAEPDPGTAVPSWRNFLQRRIGGFLTLPNGDLLVASYDGLWKIDGDHARPGGWAGAVPERVFSGDTDGSPRGRLLSLGLDAEGNVLAGTREDGLLRFRGEDYANPEVHTITWNVFGMSGIPSMAASPVDGSIYLATGSGLRRVRFRPGGGEPEVTRITDVSTHCVVAGSDGRIYLAAHNGVLSFADGEAGPSDWLHAPMPSPLGSRALHALSGDGEGGILIGTMGAGLKRFNGDFSDPSFLTTIRSVQHAPDLLVSALAPVPGRPGEVYVGSTQGLGRIRVSDDGDRYTPLLPWWYGPHLVSEILPLSDVDVLAGVALDGLVRVREDSFKYRVQWLSGGTRFSVIEGDGPILEDVEVWLPIFDFSGMEFERVKLENFRLNTFLYRPGAGRIDRFDDEDGAKVYMVLDLVVDVTVGDTGLGPFVTLFVFSGRAEGADEYGGILLLDLDEWLYGVETEWVGSTTPLFDPELVEIVLRCEGRGPTRPENEGEFSLDLDEERSEFRVTVDAEPPIAPVKLGGTFVVQMETFPVPLEPPSPTALITAMVEDEAGNVLIGTQEDGLYRTLRDVDPADPPEFHRVPGLPRKISSLAAGGQGGVFVGGFEEGLYRVEGYDTPSPSVRRIGQGKLLTEYVTALCTTPRGCLVIGMYDNRDKVNSGLTVYRKDPVSGEESFLSLTSEHGLIPARVQDILLEGQDLYVNTVDGLFVIQAFPDLVDALLAAQRGD